MKSAPLLGQLRSKGGTLLTLSNTTDDFSYLLSNSDITIVPSHFAVLELPDWEDTTDQSLYYDGTTMSPSTTDPNLIFPKVVQNYMENMLAYSEANRTDNSLSNYSEQAFFKMMRLLGGMSFLDDGTTTINGNTHTVYKEDIAQANYNQVVKYVGKSNMVNHRKDSEGNEYVEYTIHIPTESGLMTDIRFIPNVDVTHNSGLIPTGGGAQYTSGLDSYANTEQVDAIYDTVSNEYEVGSDLTDLGIDFDDILNDTAKHKQGDYEFNAILVYYTIYDKTDTTTAKKGAWGLHLIEDFGTAVGGVSSVSKLKKYQPDTIQSGNAYNFVLKFNFGTTVSQIATTTTNEFAFDEFLGAINQINKLQDKYDTLLSQWQSLQGTIHNITASLGNLNQINEALTRLSTAETNIANLQSWQSGGNGQRITNEELFSLFANVNNALTNANGAVTVNAILSSRAFLPNVIDKDLLIVEYNGAYYKYNQSTNTWDTYTL